MTDTTPTQSTAFVPPLPESPAAPAADATASAGAPTPTGSPAVRPRLRWAAIIWGAALAAIAGFALWITVSPDRRTGLADWTTTLTPAAAAAYILLAIGAVALVGGLVGIVRRLQRGIERRVEVLDSTDDERQAT